MTAIAAPTSAARYLSDDALASDLIALTQQLLYSGAAEYVDGLIHVHRDRADTRLLHTWDALNAERDTRHAG